MKEVLVDKGYFIEKLSILGFEICEDMSYFFVKIGSNRFKIYIPDEIMLSENGAPFVNDYNDNNPCSNNERWKSEFVRIQLSFSLYYHEIKLEEARKKIIVSEQKRASLQ